MPDESHHRSDPARERYESPEMAAETVHGTTAWGLVVASLLVLLSVPAWRLAGDEPFPAAALLDGWSEARAAEGAVVANRDVLAAIEAFETSLEDTSPVLEMALPDLQWLQLRFGGRGNETVYAGASSDGGGWLLLRTGFDHLVGRPFLDAAALEGRRRAADSWRPEPSPDPRPALLDFHRQLKERGVDLVLLPVPTKPAVESASLAPGVPRPLSNASFRPFAEELEAAGIRVFDIAPELRELTQSGTAAFLRTDSHWSPEAVSSVTQRLASWLEDTYGESDEGLGAADAFWQATPTTRTGRGDLWRLLKLPDDRPIYAEESVEASEITLWDGSLWSPQRDAPVLVLGDSFVNVYSDESLHWGRAAGFAEQLSFHLERGVDRLARNDGASDQVRKDLARTPERLDSKRVVVYVFASRELSVGDWPVVPAQ